MSLPAGLPEVSSRRLAVRVTPDALRQVRGGHPWIYDDSITRISHRGAPGDLAVIFDAERRFAAIGLNDPASPIRIKVLHHGRPTDIDRDFWRRGLEAAVALRRPLSAADPSTTGMRVVNGENDGFPGLVIDRYGDTVVAKLYSAAWYAHLASVVPVVVDTLRPKAMVLRLSRALRGAGPPAGLEDGIALHGEAPVTPVMFVEHGLHFEADVVHGQKTGHFLDQRENRILAGSLVDGARVLDVFASTGGFTVHAAAGGARSVTSVDLSAPTLAVAERNLAHNRRSPGVLACHHHPIVGDAFEVMDRLIRERQRYDVVIVDPPSFAQRQESVERAVHAYGQLTQRAVRLLDEGGLLVQASCSSRVPADQFFATVRASATLAGHPLLEVRRTGHPLDHPVTFPQGAYLKAIFARRDG